MNEKKEYKRKIVTKEGGYTDSEIMCVCLCLCVCAYNNTLRDDDEMIEKREKDT